MAAIFSYNLKPLGLLV